MRASLIQIDVKPDESVDSRRARAAGLVRDQAGADLVVLPELWTVGAFAYDDFAPGAEPLDGPTAAAMSAAARDAGVWLHAGSIVERVPRAGAHPEADDRGRAPEHGDAIAPEHGRDARAPEHGGDALHNDALHNDALYNTALLFAPDGRLHRVYRKIHRFGFDKGEAALMSAGEDIVTAHLPGPDLTLGLTTCYDLRFPEQFRLLVDAGAQAVVVSAGWPARRREHWSLLARARAVESQAYVLACCSAGTHAGVEQAGHSVVVDPWGEVLAEAGAGEQVLTVELDPARVERTRADFPVLRDRVLGVPTPKRPGA
ncbi:carbon-nitrogen family hydrolase [Streptantibioticus parmotrematis]|uniref:carbon-nitrogen family hydrolase n=1 Tax=Streptantibioticus parmotrematis TaxID=2873249 RepID=UPI0033EBCE21